MVILYSLEGPHSRKASRSFLSSNELFMVSQWSSFLILHPAVSCIISCSIVGGGAHLLLLIWLRTITSESRKNCSTSERYSKLIKMILVMTMVKIMTIVMIKVIKITVTIIMIKVRKQTCCNIFLPKCRKCLFSLFSSSKLLLTADNSALE